MRGAILALTLLLTSCGGRFWLDVPVAYVHAVGDDPRWPSQVAYAVGVWNHHLRAIGCPPPFALSASGRGHAVVLLPDERWDHARGSGGYAQSDTPWRVGRIAVREELGPDPRATVLLHELGHAMGLEHSADPGSIMHVPPLVSYISFRDVTDAAALMRCP